jgi:hypothetical protein
LGGLKECKIVTLNSKYGVQELFEIAMSISGILFTQQLYEAVDGTIRAITHQTNTIDIDQKISNI